MYPMLKAAILEKDYWVIRFFIYIMYKDACRIMRTFIPIDILCYCIYNNS